MLKIQWAGRVARIWETNEHNSWVGKADGKLPLGSTKRSEG